ncbi:hypothetical protein PanWU01x14_211910 [Parasponia andersonii]|uniref:Uncharacterized protein n=1 Tax=Parasponia andersonii TaxID=3476 RepID=A0A2P5BTF5_PARAD|nr:hypothetical protein PanWU01x14_211910 [Parasponia andersonii]
MEQDKTESPATRVRKRRRGCEQRSFILDTPTSDEVGPPTAVSQLLSVDGDDKHLCLKVWDLKDETADHAKPSLPLAHQVVTEAFEFVLAFHPSHAD